MQREYMTEKGLIDFKYKAAHSTLVELATIRKGGFGVEGQAKRNISELKKLSRFSRKTVRTRYLLILDFFHPHIINKSDLEFAYKKEWKKLSNQLGKQGKQKEMEKVTVLYVHLEKVYKFVLPRMKL